MPKPQKPNLNIPTPKIKPQAPIPEKVAQPETKKPELNKIVDYVKTEIRNDEIEEGLAEIYQGEDGKLANIQKINIKKTHGIIFRAFFWLLSLAVIGGLVYGGYHYYSLKQAGKSDDISIEVSADNQVVAGKDFSYTITYKNLSAVDLKDVNIKVTYPDNFIYGSGQPVANDQNNNWSIDTIPAKRSGEIKVIGKLVNEVDLNNILIASMTYTPANFSSEFSKQASYNIKVSDFGLNLNFDAPASVLIGETNNISLKYQAKTENYLNNFRVTIVPAENLEFSTSTVATATPGVWQVNDISDKEGSLDLKFKLNSKLTDSQNLVLKFEYSPDGQKYLTFFQKQLPFDIMTKNLNLNLIINGSNKDQAVDFGQTLNYSIAYNNKGDSSIKNIVIMATIDSDFVDWNSLIDKSKGQVRDNKIYWTKEQIPELESLGPNTSGSIDFSIKVKSSGQTDPTKNYQVKSYARFSINTLTDGVTTATASSTASSTNSETLASSTPSVDSTQDSDNNKSNEIINKINSDLSIKEQVRYFNDDNIAVGSGPLPPKVGETTGYKVYWDLTNSLNELDNLVIQTTLPSYVNWDSKNTADIGTIDYSSSTRVVTWNLGRLPITTSKASASFNITVVPTDIQKNKILVLLQSTSILAIDSVTGSKIEKSIPAKTSKLEDEPAIVDDGRVQ